MTSTHSLTGTQASASALQTKVERKRKASFSSKVLGCISALIFTFASLTASAVAIPGATLTTTAGSPTVTATCVNGYFASGWFGGPAKVWTWTVSTAGYEHIDFLTPTSSSATGPHSAQFQWSINGTTWNSMSTLVWSGTGCQSSGVQSLPTGADNQSTFYVRAIMTGASASGGTSRMSIQAFSGDLIPTGCTTIDAGTIAAGTSSFCGSGSTTITSTGSTAGTGISYQWQKSPAGAGTWSNVGTSSISLNTGSISASTDYRLIATCSTGPIHDTSNVVTLTVNSLPNPGTLSFASGSNPFQVGDAINVDATGGLSGGTFSSSNTNALDVDPITGAGTSDFGGTAVVSYTVTDNVTLCTNSATLNVDMFWPNTLALYAGVSGTSTTVIPGDVNVVVTPLASTGFGSSSPCGSGGLSGLTVNTSITSFVNGNPHVSYKVTPTSGNVINVFQIHARARVSGTGPTKARLAYSYDGINWIPDAEITLTSGSCGASANSWYWTTGGPTITGITGDFYVAIFPYASGSNTGVFQVNTLEIYGEVSNDDPCSGGSLDMGELTAASGNTNICGSGYRTLEFLHNGGVGISYQYQIFDGTNWVNTSVADTNIFFNTGTLTTTTDYRVVVSCAGGGSIASAPLTITVIPDQPHDIVSPASTVYFVDGFKDFTTVFTNTGLTPDSVKWVSNNVATADVDASGVVGNFNFPANDVRITRVKYNGGCATATTDTFDIIHECAIAYYLGENGTSVDVTDVQSVTSSNLASTGFGTGTNCSSGGKSGMNTTPASFSTSGAHVSYETTNNEDVMALSGLHATVRISSTGPMYARLAYRVHDGISWGSWIDEGADHEITPDDCGYSNDEIHWCEAGAGALSLPVLTSGQKIEVAVFPHAPVASGGSFQLNSMTICGSVADLCAGEPQSTEIWDEGDANITNTTLPEGANALHLNGTAPSATYWTISGVTNEAYFGCATTGGNVGVLNVADAICNVTITGYGFRPAGSCFTKVQATNVDLIDDCGGKSTGVTNAAKTVNVSFFPNPATHTVNVVAAEGVTVSVVGIDGKVLIAQTNAKSINVSALASGVYFIKAYDADNNVIKTEKLIKQ